MKKILSLIIALIIAALSVLSAAAAVSPKRPVEFEHNDYPGIEFANDWDDNLMVTGYTGTNPELVVPETVYNKQVTRFESNALDNNTVVKSVIMNDNMTMIRSWAFNKCTNLSYVYYSKKLQVIEKNAFSYDDSLTSAFLRNTLVRSIYANAYMSCPNLEYVSLPDTMESIEGAGFYKTAIRKLVIPSGTTTIGARSFAQDTKLEKLYVPASVENIGSSVLDGSTNVTVYTPENSAMYTYCQDNSINCEALSEEDFPSRLLGDTNGDKEVNINDVTFIQREIAGYKTDFYPDNCDYNGDCKLNINDGTDIQLHIVGLK